MDGIVIGMVFGMIDYMNTKVDQLSCREQLTGPDAIRWVVQLEVEQLTHYVIIRYEPILAEIVQAC